MSMPTPPPLPLPSPGAGSAVHTFVQNNQNCCVAVLYLASGNFVDVETDKVTGRLTDDEVDELVQLWVNGKRVMFIAFLERVELDLALTVEQAKLLALTVLDGVMPEAWIVEALEDCMMSLDGTDVLRELANRNVGVLTYSAMCILLFFFCG